MATNYNITSSNAGYGPLYTRQDVTNQSPKELRYVQQATVFSRPGVVGGLDFKVSYASSFTLTVKAGTAYVGATSQGYYTQVMPVDGSVVLDSNASASARIDRIFLAIGDRDNSGGAEEAVIYVVVGTAGAGVPATTTMDATYKATLELARVSIPASTTSNLSTATITDFRTYAPVSSVIPTTSSNRPSAAATWPTTSAFTGLGIYETDTKSLRFYDGTNWVPSGIRPFNTTGVYAGSAPNISTSQLLMQAGTSVTMTNASGLYTVTFPSAFPNGVVSVVATNGDDTGSAVVLNSPTLSGFTASFGVGSVLKRCNWIAIGW